MIRLWSFRSWSFCVSFLLLILFSIPSFAACTPCAVSYTLDVRYLDSGADLQSASLTGSAQVSDGTVDLNVASVQNLLIAQRGPAAFLTTVVSIALNGGVPGKTIASHDTLIATAGEVIAWVDAPIGQSSQLHLTTLAARRRRIRSVMS
jgi:hypothetical protein